MHSNQDTISHHKGEPSSSTPHSCNSQANHLKDEPALYPIPPQRGQQMGTWARACGQLDGVAICVSKGHESRVWTKKVCLCEVGWCPYWNIVGVVFCFFSFWEYRSMYGLFFPFCPKLEVFVSNYHFSEKKS
jgi:hypothetical protein